MNKVQSRHRQTQASKAVQRQSKNWVGCVKDRKQKSWSGQSTNQKKQTKTRVTLQGHQEAWMIGITGGE